MRTIVSQIKEWQFRAMRILVLIVLGLTATTAAAATSEYTNLDLTKCKSLGPVQQEDGGGSWECKGLKDYPVVYSEGDLRGTIAFGRSADIQCAASQSFGHFNSPGKTIEWRMNKGKPFATILRWFTDNGEPDGKQNWLVVTKIDSDDVCRTAIIDTQYPNANEAARLAADQAVNFICSKDLPTVISAKPMKATDVMSGIPCSPP
jgi:hypothetical protein